MNTRFMIWINDGWVKLTLRPGQTLDWHHAWQHEEGWSSEGVTWEYDGQQLTCTADTDGRDCDGRSSQSTVTTCRANMVKARAVTLDGTTHLLPQWETVDQSQRDYSAEAANY